MWEREVQRWAREWLPVIAEHRGPGRFGERAYWVSLYARERGPDEWFLPARAAAESAVEVCSSARRVLHPGCGRSTLGAAVAELCDVDEVVNLDCSDAVLRQLERRVELDYKRVASKQRYEVWDAREWWDGGKFDLALDKGTLDAVQFAGGDALVAYCAMLRHCVDGVYVHWSDDPPEMKSGLLRAAFSNVSCEQLDTEWTYFRYVVKI